MSNVILPLFDETLQLLSLKHPEAQAHQEAISQGLKKLIHSIVYESIDVDLVKKAASRILVSSQFGSSPLDLSLRITNIHLSNSDTKKKLEALMAIRIIPQIKNPIVRPIGVTEVLRRIAGKVFMYMAKKYVLDAAGSLQVCAGQEAGSEAVIHTIYDVYKQYKTKAVFLVDAE